MAEIKVITFGNDQSPDSVTIRLPIAEAAALARLLGKQRGADNPGTSDQLSAVYACLTGSIFNAHWEDGVDGWFKEARRG